MMKWQSIETIPTNKFVDVWLISKKNPDWGVRVCNVCKTDKHSSGWVGIEQTYLTDYILPAFWIDVGRPEGV